MEKPPVEPLILCLENTDGEEVSVEIEAHDNFQMFLDKAKSLLGFDIDLNSITNNQPVALTDSIYDFLINTERSANDLGNETFDQMLEPSANDDLVYILDDGTQIKASQIHFDNEDPPVDLTAEEIPFVKYADNSSEDEKNLSVETTKKINIVESPVNKWSSQHPSPKCFINSLPFKLVCNNTSNFEAQFTKYLESSTKNNTSNYNYDKVTRKDEFNLTREDILNMFKDAPVTSIPYDETSVSDKRKHVRKTDPSRLVHKTWNSKPLSCVVDSHSEMCFICRKFVDSNLEKLYLFDNEDQKLHRCSPQRRYSTQLKILCEQCLAENFKSCSMKSPSQSLKSDEYLIIKNNQQYIFKKVTSINLKDCDNEFILPDGKDRESFINKQSMDYVKIEIGSDGEIVTKSLNDEPRSSDDVIIVKDENKDSSDVEIIEPDDSVIENLDDCDEDVKEFLGKYQCDNNDSVELKCRFCEQIFENISQVIEHGEEHKHDLEDGCVFPCPLCDYGYANLKWLKGHLKAAHDKPKEVENGLETKETSPTPVHSPVAKRTRSAVKKNDCQKEKDKNAEEKTSDDPPPETTETKELEMEIKTEVKQEVVDSSDDEIWILQTGDEDATGRLQKLLQSVKIKNEDEPEVTKVHNCANCSQSFTSTAGLLEHKCVRRRGRKRKPKDGPVCVPTKEDFYKRAQGRVKLVSVNNDLLVERPRKKRNRQPTSDPQIVTCHNCNESFTSKVRLKFHMQFHETNTFLTPTGEYQCPECDGTQFPTESELFDHVHFKHDKQKRWQCPVKDCGKTFFLRATLTKHSRTHTDTRRYACETCGKRFLDKQTLDEHGVTHLQIKPFQCHICLKQLTRRSRLRMHLRAHEEELRPKLVLVCAVCCRAFRDHVEAQEHASKSAECLTAFTSELKDDTEAVTEQLSPTSGVVRHTIRIVESPKLSKPIDREVVDTESEALLSALEDSARPIIRVVRIEKAFRCEYCEDVFYQEDALNTHRGIHKGVKNPFTCHICKVSFATYSRCTTHKTTHGFYKRSLADAKKQTDNPQPEAGPSATGILGYGGFPVVKHFLCEDCGRSYLHWTYLQVHRRMKHANENFIFKCNQCDMTFPNSWSVAYHRKKVHGKTVQEDGGVTKIAREDYRIPCRDCDEILPNKTALYKHRKKEHSDGSLCVNSNEGTFNTNRTACSKCGHNFTQPQDLQKHLMSVHGHESRRKPHACPLCTRSFRAASGRDEHLRVHTGERPYPCDVCGVAFRRSTAMRNHRLIHTGVRAWACAQCPKRFRIRSDLRTHLRLKHPAHLVVIEAEGLNPSAEEILNLLKKNNINDKVLEITLMSFEKGTSSIIPHSSRALSMLGSVPRTQLMAWKPATDTPDNTQPARRGRGIAKDIRRPEVFEGEAPPDQNEYPVALTVSEEALSALNVQLMLSDGVLVNGNEMVQLQLDNMLLE
ncbi:uncharacterized protein [Epargyreus clarus]|uniref:uncharacterized protein n=1 Tax=Epargyreus clarus TaxID=520877 RepID=UPI003C2D54D6